MADGAIWSAMGDWNALTSGVGAGSTIDITGSGGGVTPMGMLVFYSLRPASLPGTAAHLSRGVGMAVSSPSVDYGCAYIASEDGQSSSDCSRAFGRKGESLDAVLVVLTPGTSTVLVRLTVDSFIANGVRLTIEVDDDSLEIAIGCHFFENDCALLEIDTNNQTTISSINFSYSDAFRFFVSTADNAYAATAGDSRLSMGMADDDGEGLVAAWEDDGSSPAVGTASNWGDAVVNLQTAQYSYTRYGLTNISGSLADMTVVGGSAKDAKILCFSADVDAYIAQDLLPSSTGTDALSGAGFLPTGFVYLLNADTTAEINAGGGGDTVSQGVTVATKTDTNVFSTGGATTDAATPTTDCFSWAASALRLHKPANVEHIATVSSWDADGITWNYTQADAADTATFAFLKGRESAGATTEDTGPGQVSDVTGAALTTIRGVPLKDDQSPAGTRDLDGTIVPADITGNLQVDMTWTWTTANQGTVYLLSSESTASPRDGVYVFHRQTTSPDELVYRVTTAGVDSDATEAHTYSAGDEKTLSHIFTDDVSGLIDATVKFGRDASDGSRTAMSLRSVEMKSLKVETPENSPDPSDPESIAQSSLDVVLSTDTEGAAIYYTLDASAPDPDASPPVGTLYSAAITLFDDTRIRAKASKTNWATSDELDVIYNISPFQDGQQTVDTNRVWTRYDPTT